MSIGRSQVERAGGGRLLGLCWPWLGSPPSLLLLFLLGWRGPVSPLPTPGQDVASLTMTQEVEHSLGVTRGTGVVERVQALQTKEKESTKH